MMKLRLIFDRDVETSLKNKTCEKQTGNVNIRYIIEDNTNIRYIIEDNTNIRYIIEDNTNIESITL